MKHAGGGSTAFLRRRRSATRSRFARVHLKQKCTLPDMRGNRNLHSSVSWPKFGTLFAFSAYMLLRSDSPIRGGRPGKNQTFSGISQIVGLRERGRRFVRSHGWPETILIIIGIVAVLTVLGSIFIAAGTTPAKLYVDGNVAPVDSELFLNSLSNLVNAPLDQGGTVTILNNGDEFLPALIDA